MNPGIFGADRANDECEEDPIDSGIGKVKRLRLRSPGRFLCPLGVGTGKMIVSMISSHDQTGE